MIQNIISNVLIMNVSGRKLNVDWVSQCVHHRMDLGISTAASDPNALIFLESLVFSIVVWIDFGAVRITCTGVRLGFFDHVPHVAGALELMIDVEDLVLQVNIPDRQTAELGNPDPRVEQDVNHGVVLAVTVVVMDKLQEFVHLLFRDRFSCHGIIHHHSY